MYQLFKVFPENEYRIFRILPNGKKVYMIRNYITEQTRVVSEQEFNFIESHQILQRI